MDVVYIGKVVTTHGIHGEIRILSDFSYKEKAFQIGTHLLFEKQEQEYEIVRYRRHKQYDMITLKEFNNINQVLAFKGKKVYKKREELKLEDTEVLEEDLLHYQVITNKEETGEIIEIFKVHPTKQILRVKVKQKEYLIPYEAPFVRKIDKVAQKIFIDWMEW